MDEDTIEEHFAADEVIETAPDNLALDVGDDTVVTSAAPPDDDDSPWPDRSQRIRAVFFTSGSTRIAR
ncbi:MAG: hypothetical protein M4D80_22225 [Myxococcota bacterium]|nr:hypothetical protein [Deltaproteobacteria bacterium]MDQ3337888.1 hypothetical protein [Myxococcota bacterium]